MSRFGVPRFSVMCRSLGCLPGTVEQQILRGQFKPSATTTPGKARVWTIGDVGALAIFQVLFGAGRPADEASQLSHLIPLGYGRRFLLAWRLPGRWSAGWTHDIVEQARFDFSKWTASKGISWAVVVDLEKLASQATTAFETASQIEMPSPTENSDTKPRKRKSRR